MLRIQVQVLCAMDKLTQMIHLASYRQLKTKEKMRIYNINFMGITYHATLERITIGLQSSMQIYHPMCSWLFSRPNAKTKNV